MKLPGIMPYRPSQVTWPASATPDYGGDIGLVVHDGSFPYFVSMTGKTLDLPGDMDSEVDRLYGAAAEEFNPGSRSRHVHKFNGFAMYGHLVNGHFFIRYAMRFEEARGTRKMTGDLGMARATAMRIMLKSGKLHQDYRGHLWMAQSRPVLSDAQFGRQHNLWQGHPVIECPFSSRTCPKVPCFGALLTDSFVPYSPAAKISWRATEDQLEDLCL